MISNEFIVRFIMMIIIIIIKLITFKGFIINLLVMQ